MAEPGVDLAFTLDLGSSDVPVLILSLDPLKKDNVWLGRAGLVWMLEEAENLMTESDHCETVLRPRGMFESIISAFILSEPLLSVVSCFMPECHSLLSVVGFLSSAACFL